MKKWNSDKFRAILAQSIYNKAHIAEECGIKLTSLYQITQGTTKPSRSVLILLAQVLEVPINDLIPEEELKNNQESA